MFAVVWERRCCNLCKSLNSMKRHSREKKQLKARLLQTLKVIQIEKLWAVKTKAMCWKILKLKLREATELGDNSPCINQNKQHLLYYTNYIKLQTWRIHSPHPRLPCPIAYISQCTLYCTSSMRLSAVGFVCQKKEVWKKWAVPLS